MKLQWQSLLVIFLFPFSSLALPILGESVVYSGQAVMEDGLYDIRKLIKVDSYDAEKREFTLLTTYEQSAEGAPLGAVDGKETVLERYYQVIEQGLLPSLKTDCGKTFGPDDERFQTLTTRETIQTPMGMMETCKLEYPVQEATKVIHWWSEKTAPWPVRSSEHNVITGLGLTLTIESLSRPSAQTKP